MKKARSAYRYPEGLERLVHIARLAVGLLLQGMIDKRTEAAASRDSYLKKDMGLSLWTSVQNPYLHCKQVTPCLFVFAACSCAMSSSSRLRSQQARKPSTT